jgi:hypothetical protein
MSDKKQTAVQWLYDELSHCLHREEVCDLLYKLEQKALQMEREQIEEVAMYHRDSAVEIDCIRSYMKKNYGGQDESNH